MRTVSIKLHSFADRHGFVGHVEKEHILLAGAYVCAAIFHLEIALALAYMLAACCCFFARKA